MADRRWRWLGCEIHNIYTLITGAYVACASPQYLNSEAFLIAAHFSQSRGIHLDGL